jgi:hypothetical protein
LPLLLTGHLNVDITTFSCFVAVCLASFFKWKTVLLIRKDSLKSASSDLAIFLMLLYVFLGGSAVAYLKSSIYQEVDFWSAAFCAVFVFSAIRGVVEGQYSLSTLTLMSCSAGLTLLTRVSTGLGTCVAFGLLVVFLVSPQFFMARRHGSSSVGSALLRSIGSRNIFAPFLLLCVFLLAAGTVNYFRWGSPFKFADHTLYLMNAHFPDRMPRTRLYGYFNVKRIPFGIIYYFFPIWVLHAPSGKLFFEATQFRLMDAIELPPSSFFLTDLLPFCFTGFLFSHLKKRSLGTLSGSLPVSIGLAIPCILMLTAISMNYRYRMDFYPEIDLLGFLGLYVLSSDRDTSSEFWMRRRWMKTATILSITFAFFFMILYKLSTWGPSQDLLRNGIVHYYADEVRNI